MVIVVIVVVGVVYLGDSDGVSGGINNANPNPTSDTTYQYLLNLLNLRSIPIPYCHFK